jgi:hypothetical protein
MVRKFVQKPDAQERDGLSKPRASYAIIHNFIGYLLTLFREELENFGDGLEQKLIVLYKYLAQHKCMVVIPGRLL